MAAIWDHGPADQAECFVLLALADFANDAGKCWPAVGTVARKVRMSKRGVQKIIARLEVTGWLSIERGGGRKKMNTYQINSEPDTANAVHLLAQKRRTPEPKRVNLSAEKGEPRSPEPSGTIKEPNARARAKSNPPALPADSGRSDCEGERPAEIDEYLSQVSARGGGRKSQRKGVWP